MIPRYFCPGVKTSAAKRRADWKCILTDGQKQYIVIQ